MSDEPQTLQDLARLASERHDGKRGRALGRIAAKHGLTLTYTTFDNIYSGKYMSTPKRETVDALAYLAGVTKEKAYAAAGLPLPLSPFAEQLPPDVDTLDADQRRVLIEMARVLVKQNRQIHDLERAGDGDGNATPNRQAGVSPATSDSTGDNVHELFTPPPPADETAAYHAPNRGRQAKEEQDRDAEQSQDPDDHQDQ